MQLTDLRIILKVRVGSRAYGFATPESDDDIRGICLPPPRYLLGLQDFEQYDDRVNDITFFSLKKYLRLALAANPNVLELLWVEPEDLLYADEYGRLLLKHRRRLLSRRIYHTFGGYARAQLKRLVAKGSGTHGARPGLVRACGYDCKHAVHLIRLLEMGIEALSEGVLRVRRPDADRLLAIRRGEYTLDQVLALSDGLWSRLEEAYRASHLPDAPDHDFFDTFLTRLTFSYLLSAYDYRAGLGALLEEGEAYVR